MTVTLVTTVTTLLAPTWNGSQWVRTVASDATILAGDSLVVLVGGGNHVTAYPGGDWQQLDLQTGQEAQGFIMARRFTATPSPASWTVSFDGSDKALVSVLHFRGTDVTWEIDAKLRSGAVGVTQPAGLVDITGPGKGDMEFYFAFCRNSFGGMPTADGDALATLSLGNETGALYRDLPTVTDTKHVGLPSRTGHYVVALGVYIPTPGPWRSDSVEFWSGGTPTASLSPNWSSDTATGSNTIHQTSSYQDATTAQDVANHTWAGTGDVSVVASESNPKFTMNHGALNFLGIWEANFAALARADGYLQTFTAGELPPTVYDSTTSTYVDPEVRDVEWETTPEPTGQRVTIHAEATMIPNGDPLNSRAIFHIYAIAEPVAGALTPTSFTAPATIQGGTLLATTTATPAAGSGGSYSSEDFEYTGGLLGSDAAAPLRLRIAAIDHITETGTAYTPPNDGSDHGAQLQRLTAALEQSYQPAYRLIYRHPPDVLVRTVARLWPRDDGLGISSAPRIWPPTKANRIIGGYQ